MRFKLTTNDKTVSCKELTVSLYKDLLKSIYGDEVDLMSYIDTIYDILNNLTGEPISFFKELSVIELLSCILQIRVNTFGDRIKINLTKEEAKTSLELRINWILDDLNILDKSIISKTIESEHFTIHLEPPTTQRLIEKTDEDYLYFVSGVTIGDKLITIKTNADAKLFVDKLPAKIALDIVKHFESVIREIQNFSFLDRYGIVEQNFTFVPSAESVLWFTKLVFNEPLDVFYDNLFYLAYLGHIDNSYIESCTPGEYMYFVRKLEAIQAQQRQSEETPSNSQTIGGRDQAINEI
jgi:hypothetical protein